MLLIVLKFDAVVKGFSQMQCDTFDFNVDLGFIIKVTCRM
jgi:hypothetical protein